MRCPKCGAFIEDGKDTCFMCGANVNSFQGSGTGFANDYMRQKEAYDNRNDYRNVQITAKEGDKDVFDFFQEHKLLIQFIGIVFTVALIAFIGYKYYNSKVKVTAKKAVIAPLYYEMDPELNLVNSNNGDYYYSRSGSAGVECWIRINYGTGQSNDHVREYFDKLVAEKTPALDENGNVENSSDEFVTQEGTMTINEIEWHYLNLFYRDASGSGFTSLRYRYITSLYNGRYYNIEFFNNSNDVKCTNSIDGFSRTLEFLKEETGE